MNTVSGIVWATIALRASALAAVLAGDVRLSSRLYALADLVEAGRATDEHMRLVAEKLKSRDISEADWDDVMARINADSDRLQAP